MSSISDFEALASFLILRSATHFTHADAGQMHLYCNYAREHLMEPGENPPIGLLLCAEKEAAVAKYTLDGLPDKVLASEYKIALPDEELLEAELDQTRRRLEARQREGPEN